MPRKQIKRPTIRLSVIWLLLVLSARAVTLPEIPRTSIEVMPDRTVSFSWEALSDQVYRVERSTTLAPGSWQAMTDVLTGNGKWQSFVDPEPQRKAFYRVSIVDEMFSPAGLGPVWQLDAASDFSSSPEDAPVASWTGNGIASLTQGNPSSRPVYRQGAVVFDGAGDHLDFPMWSGGVGPNFTLALLLKVRPSVSNYRILCGGSFEADRALELSWFEGDIGTRIQSNQDFGLIRSAYKLYPGENWRVLVIRSQRGLTRTRLDGIETVLGISLKNVGQSGTFQIGCGYDGGFLSAPISLRYAAYFPSVLGDEDCGKLERWMERRKLGEYPPTQVFLGGGQSNYAYSFKQEGRALNQAFPNAAVFPSSHYSATSLMAWMRDREGGGYEVTPRVDLGDAPEGSRAYGRYLLHGGDAVIEELRIQVDRIRRNPKSLSALLFTQGENDTDDAVYQWKPNGQAGSPVDYDAHYTDPFALAKSYGPRSVAWNQAVRKALGLPEMFCVYERVNYVNLGRTAIQTECEYLQRDSQLKALKDDPRYLVVDTSEFPREDGIHFSVAGANRFAQASIRLLKEGERLAQLPYEARMLAMRAVDSGFELNDARIEACRALAASPGYPMLNHLFIPKLVASDPIEQDRLRRCNLMVHHGGTYPLSFISFIPEHTIAYCDPGADQQAIANALQVFQAAWGVDDLIEFPE